MSCVSRKATAEFERWQFTEGEASRLYETNQHLQDRIRDYSDTANYLTSRVTRCFQGLDKIPPMLKSVVTLGVSVG